MRRQNFPAATALLACVLGSLPLSAAETTGWIAAIDEQADFVTLHDGRTFALPDDINAAGLILGARVRITYAGEGRNMRVLCLAPVPVRKAHGDRRFVGTEYETCSTGPSRSQPEWAPKALPDRSKPVDRLN